MYIIYMKLIKLYEYIYAYIRLQKPILQQLTLIFPVLASSLAVETSILAVVS